MAKFFKIFLLVGCLFSASLLALDYADEEEAESKKTWLKNPAREVSVIITDVGYYPEKIVVFKNEKVKFYITSTTEEASCFIIDQHKVFAGVKKGKVVEAEVIVENAGQFNVYCPTSKHSAQLLVLEKKIDKPKREIASQSKNKKIWTPKEY